MVFRRQIKKGFENRVFANSRRISENIIESDELLESIYLEEIQDAPANPPVTPPQTTPVNPANPPSNEQSANKEENKP